ncbi:MAG: hypothetical protein J6W59_02255, partial [Bacteroidales bacterium]|nr:hypothetical protein [Bacteroidales bacterium]
MLSGQRVYGNLFADTKSAIGSSGKYNFFVNNILVNVNDEVGIGIDNRGMNGAFGNDHVNYETGDMWDHLREGDYLSDVMRLAVPVNLLMLEQSGYSSAVDDPGSPTYNTAMNNIMITNNYAGHRIYILAPLVRSRKGHYRELFESMRRKGYLNIRVDGEIMELTRGMKVDRYKNHDIEVVVDKGIAEDSERLRKSVSIAMKEGDGLIMILDKDTGSIKHYSKRLMCPTTGISYSDPAPNNFSFNSPQGACPHCKGLGVINQIDLEKVIPDRSQNIYNGGIVPLGKYKNQMIFWQVEAILKKYDCNLKTPISELPDEAMREVLYGSLENVRIDKEIVHTTSDYFVTFDGIIKYLRNVMDNDDSASGQRWADQFLAECECQECHGQRLNREALSYRIWDKNIAELASMDISELREWLDHVEDHLDSQQKKIATEILKEIRTRLDFLLEVGLDYLSLNRQSASLSGGESQRIRLATQIGSQLVNVLYILDEPSIGLHQRDNQRLINSLKQLRDLG